VPPGSARLSNRAATFYTVTIKVASLDDDVTNIDSDTQNDAVCFWQAYVGLSKAIRLRI